MAIDKTLLHKLITAYGVSGNEEEVRDIIRQAIKPYVDEVFIDRMGNLIGIKKGDKPRIMLAAHMDEVGLMVKRIGEKGFIYCTYIGDVDTLTIVALTAHIKTAKAKLHGVITTAEISAGKLNKEVPKKEEVIIDTGLSRKSLEELGVEIGTYVALENFSCCFGNEDLIFGKALDDRTGCYVLIEMAKRLKKIKNKAEIYYVFTVQEEIGLRGAKASAFNLHPDWGVVVDTTYANDSFAEPSRFLDKGPCITIKDGEFISNKCINGWLRDAAKKRKIPYQLEAVEEGSTDAATIQTTAGGIPSSVLCIPIRNIHTSIGVASLKDIEATILILEELLKKPPLVCLV